MPADQRCFRGTSLWQNHFPHLLFNNFSATPLFLQKNIERFWWLYTYSVFRWLHTELLFFTLVFKKALVESLWNLHVVFYIFVNNRDCIIFITFLNLFCPKSENFCSISLKSIRLLLKKAHLSSNPYTVGCTQVQTDIIPSFHAKLGYQRLEALSSHKDVLSKQKHTALPEQHCTHGEGTAVIAKLSFVSVHWNNKY